MHLASQQLAPSKKTLCSLNTFAFTESSVYFHPKLNSHPHSGRFYHAPQGTLMVDNEQCLTENVILTNASSPIRVRYPNEKRTSICTLSVQSIEKNPIFPLPKPQFISQYHEHPC
jgi:hypothetical protein